MDFTKTILNIKKLVITKIILKWEISQKVKKIHSEFLMFLSTYEILLNRIS